MARPIQLTTTSAFVSTATEEAVLLLDSKRRIKELTPRAAALIGRPVPDLIGLPFSDLGSLDLMGLSAREQPIYRKTQRAHSTIVTLRLIDYAMGEHNELVAPWENSVELVLVRSPEGRILAVNEAFARKFGIPRPAWAGRNPATLLHQEDLNDWTAATTRLTRPPYRGSHEHRWQTAQGWRWLSWEESAVRDVEGSIVAYRSVGRDVTKRRLAEEHYHKLANAVDQSPFSIVVTTPDGRVQYVNPKFTQSTGYTLEEIFEKEIPVLREGHANDESFREFEQTVAAGRKWSGELCTRCKDGRNLWEFVQVSPIRNHNDEITHLLSMREDITERKKLEDQLRQAQKMESLGTLAGGIAHDFNNVLAIINGFTEIALSRGPSDEAQAKHLREIHNAAQRAIGLVRQILTFSRKTEVTFKSVPLNQHVKDLGRMCAETFPRTVSFSIEIDETLPALWADPNQLQQVIMNLCVNARDAMPNGGLIAISTSRVEGSSIVRLGAEASRAYVCIKVSDTGCGMPPHVRARIFEPFFTTKQNSGGTGLGLAVVYGIILNHRGFLDVESAEGQGSAFHVYLPLETPKAGALTVDPATIPAGEFPHGDETILVVEDEGSLRELLCTILEPRGFKVLIAADGARAVDVLLSEPSTIDVVLLDLNLPQLNGVDVYKTLRRLRPEAKVIIISGNITPDTRRELNAHGEPEFLPKPYQIEELGRRLRTVLRSAKAVSVA
jgi:PAS domain S-box-containing protein